MEQDPLIRRAEHQQILEELSALPAKGLMRRLTFVGTRIERHKKALEQARADSDQHIGMVEEVRAATAPKPFEVLISELVDD